jgi:signal transduction histidine kinase
LAYLNEVSVELSSTLQTEILVLDNRGIVLVASSGDDVGDDLSTETIVSIALGGEEQSTFQIISGEEWLLVTVPILRDEQVNGVVYLSQPLSDVTALLNDFRIRLLLASTAAMPISALIGLVLARTIARPIRSLTVAAGKLSRGDYDSLLGTAGRDELGQLNRTFAAMRDKLQAVEQMRNRFVSDVSHELRTPLTAVKGLAETLRDGAADDPNVRDKFLSSIEDETDRLIRLVNDLLLLSRADSLALQFDHQPIDLAALATTTVEKLHPQAQARGIDLDVEFGAPIPKASADPDRIEQVLVILIDNALKHTPAEGKVRISGEKVVTSPQDPAGSASTPPLPPGTWTVLRVSDTGEGIPADDLPRVFERFYRPDHSRSRDHGGSGLGLSIAKALVEAQGGMIWLESPSPWIHTAKGKPGTTATIALPIA